MSEPNNEGQNNNQQTGAQKNSNEGAGAQNNQGQNVSIDYEKLASIINGKQTVTEDTILKNYFKQQGLSKEEIGQAIQLFKDEKAKNQPDIGEYQTQVAESQRVAREATIEKEATLEAIAMGLDVKNVPYVLKLANFSECIDEKGSVDSEKLKAAMNKVIEDVPALKPQKEEQKGFQVGGNGEPEQSTQSQVNTPTKRWNRWNN